MSGTPIHTGFWIDWSKGRILGSVLTYKANYGNQLITAAALIIALTGSAVWSLIGFVIHQRISRAPNQDELDAQFRAVVRNGGPPDAVATLLNMASTWKNRAHNAWGRSILFLMPPLFVFLSFTVAGILVSFIALDPNKSTALLKAGHLCGVVSQTQKAVAVQSISNSSLVSSAYARDCYSRDNTGAVACSTFNKATLPYTVVRNGSCPLGNGNCQNGDSHAVNLTAVLDSHDDLGINSPTQNRIQFGYTVSCAPLSYSVLDGLTTTNNDYNLKSDNDTYTFSDVSLARGYPAWQWTNATAWAALNVGSYSVFPYKTYWPHNNVSQTGYAHPPLNKTDTDVTIALINSNAIRYLAQNSDPIFATDPATRQEIPGIATVWYSDRQVNAISCTDSYKFCNGEDRCSPWQALFKFGITIESISALGKSLGYNGAQNATLFRLAYGTTDSTSLFLSMYNPTPIRAIDYGLGSLGVSKGLPDDQWVTEVESWYQISLAKMQYLTKLYANIPDSVYNDPGFQYLFTDSSYLRHQCSQQRIQIPPGYQNFSVFGLCFVFIFGFLSLLFAFLLSKYHHKLPGRGQGQAKHDKLLSYQADSYLQLHRAAMELAGHGGWFGAHDGKTQVPYTKKAERVLTQQSLVYRAGPQGSQEKNLKPGSMDDSDNNGVDGDGIDRSWQNTGITTVK